MAQTPFYRLPYGARRDLLAQQSHLTVQQLAKIAARQRSADADLIENYLTTYGLS